MIPLEKTAYFDAVQKELEHQVVDIIWHEQHKDHAVVLSIVPSTTSWFHLFTILDGEWIHLESSFSDWLAYFHSETEGVSVDLVPVNNTVTAGHVSIQHQIHKSHVSNHFLCSVVWDSNTSQHIQPFQYIDLLINGTWTACIAPWIPTTKQHFAEAYIAYHQTQSTTTKSPYWWAIELLYTHVREDKLLLIGSIIEFAELPKDEPALGALGAGPLEDLMSDWLLTQLENTVQLNANMLYALSIVRMEFEDAALQKRVSKLLKSI